MKKRIVKCISLLLKFAIPFISTIISLVIIEQFNVLLALNLMEDTKSAFNICLTTYFTTVNAILLTLVESIKNSFFKPAFLQVTFSKPGEIVQNSSIPDLLLKDNTLCEVRLTVTIIATKSTFNNTKLIIEGANFSTMQLPAASFEAFIDRNGNFIIDLEKLFGNQERANTVQTFRILFTKEPVNGICQSELYPKLTSQPWRLQFETNKLIIRTEG